MSVLQPTHRDPVAVAKENASSVREVAAQNFGYGCRQESNGDSKRLFFNCLANYPPDWIEIEKSETIYTAAIEKTHQLAEEQSQSACRFKAEGKPFKNLDRFGLSLNLDKTGSSIKEEGEAVTHCVAACLRVDHCRLRFLPRIRPSFDHVHLEKNKDMSVVTSGTVGIGYKIYIQIYTRAVKESTEGHKGLDAGASYQTMGALGLNYDQVKKTLSGHSITKIVISEARMIGDYSLPPLEGFSNVTIASHGDVLKILESIRGHFHKHYATCKGRHFIIDSSQPMTLDTFPLALPAEKKVYNQDPQNPKETNKDYFNELSKDILDSLERRYKGLVQEILGTNVELGKILSATEKAFKELLEGDSMRANHYQSYVMILGRTGVGKSLLTGHLVGGTVHTVDDYGHLGLTSDSPQRLPLVGDLGSETKGFNLFGKYLDTAGIGDTDGEEADIANGAAIQLATNLYNPGQIILVIGPEEIPLDRGKRFREMMTKLQRVLYDATEPEMLHNILFVVNSKEYPPKKNRILQQLQQLKITVLEEIKEELKGVVSISISDSLKKLGHSFFRSDDLTHIYDQVEKVSADKPLIAQEVLRKLREIEMILDIIAGGNIIITDFDNGQTKKDIEEWLEQRTSNEKRIPHGMFNAFNLYRKGKEKFLITLQCSVIYFTHLRKRERMLADSMERMEKEITAKQTLIKKIQSDKLTVEDKQQSIRTQTNNRGLLREKIQQFQSKKAETDKEIQHLQESTKLIKMPSFEPANPIQMRKWWQAIPTPYGFPLERSYPIKKVEFVSGPKGQFTPTYGGEVEYTGLCRSVKRTAATLMPSDMETAEKALLRDISNVREVIFIPGWYGHPKDTRAKIRVWTEEKSAPSTAGRINTLEQEKSKFDEHISGLEEELKRVEAELANERYLAVNDLENAKVKLSDAHEKIKKERNSIAKKLKEHQQIYRLLVKIVRSFHFDQSFDPNERNIFGPFVQEFGHVGDVILTEDKASPGEPDVQQQEPSFSSLKKFQKTINTTLQTKTDCYGLTFEEETFYKVGNCLFDAVTMYTSGIKSEDLRRLACDCIEQSPSIQAKIQAGAGEEKLKIASGNEIDYTDVNGYLTKMRQDRTWGTGIEIEALSQILKRPIYLITPSNRCDTFFGGDQKGEPIFLHYNFAHYTILSVPEGKDPYVIGQIIQQVVNSSSTDAFKTGMQSTQSIYNEELLDDAALQKALEESLKEHQRQDLHERAEECIQHLTGEWDEKHRYLVILMRQAILNDQIQKDQMEVFFTVALASIRGKKSCASDLAETLIYMEATKKLSQVQIDELLDLTCEAIRGRWETASFLVEGSKRLAFNSDKKEAFLTACRESVQGKWETASLCEDAIRELA